MVIIDIKIHIALPFENFLRGLTLIDFLTFITTKCEMKKQATGSSSWKTVNSWGKRKK